MNELKHQLSIEARLTRLETLMWVVLGLSGLSVFGIRVFDALALFHGGWP